MVVTASADCPDTYGFCDFAIGHFPLAINILEGARDIVTSHWKQLFDMGQRRWAYLFEEGLVSRQVAEEWANDIWPVHIEQEEDL